MTSRKIGRKDSLNSSEENPDEYELGICKDCCRRCGIFLDVVSCSEFSKRRRRRKTIEL
jgi:hypothetical protein